MIIFWEIHINIHTHTVVPVVIEIEYAIFDFRLVRVSVSPDG